MSTKEREQLQAELSILKELRHPNIVAYYEREHLKASQDLHLYMEYCGNGDLGRVIKNLKQKNQYADEEFVWSVFSQLITALYRCHYGQDPPEVSSNVMGLGNNAKPLKSKQAQYMILHRDLKPENGKLAGRITMFDVTFAYQPIVFLGADNSVKLGDFGLSKILSSHDFASTYVGTPFYMSPEICAAEKYTLQSDVWSLGCIMYELCVKEPPFNARTHFDLVQKIKLGRVNPLPSVYSPELRKIIESCLRVNPTTRPDTAQLLNLPIIKLMRKEQEVVTLGQQMRTEKDLASQKLREAAERVRLLEEEKEAMREEIEATVRREWEVKARLEIDRLVQVEYERLQKQFEEEVKKRLTDEISKRDLSEPAISVQQRPNTAGEGTTFDRPPTSAFVKSSTPSRDAASTASRSTADSTVDFPSGTDLSSLSLDSPTELKPRGLTNNFIKGINNKMSTRPLKRNTRTPFTRAKTMAVGVASPTDIQMADPSPASIAGLSLSPRKNGTDAKIRGVARKNIFAVAAGEKWIPEAIDSYPSFSSDEEDMNNKADIDDDNEDDDDDDDDDALGDNDVLQQSPTLAKKPPQRGAMTAASAAARGTSGKIDNRAPASLRGPSATRRRPGLAPRSNTAVFPNSRLNSAPTSLFPSIAASGATIKSRPQSTVPVVAASPVRRTQHVKGNSRGGDTGAGAGAGAGSGSPVKKGGAGNGLPTPGVRGYRKGGGVVELAGAQGGGNGSNGSNGSDGSASVTDDGNFKPATKSNNLHGRTLVELSQARTGYEGSKAVLAGYAVPGSKSAGGPREPEVIWDPERDEMPSPFLVRGKVIRA